jgi:Rod binding domain-containing protein
MLAMPKSPTNNLQMQPAPRTLAPVKPAPATLMSRTHGPRPLTPQQLAKIDAAAKDFESVYAGEMLKPMFGTVKTDPMFGGGKGEETFKSLLLQQYGKKIADTGELGLAKYVKAEMIRMQETQR